MIEVRKGQRWLFNNLDKKCRDRTHYKSKVIFEITYVYKPGSKVSEGAQVKAKAVQIISDKTFGLDDWLFSKEELSNLKCSCFECLDGQDKPQRKAR